MTTYLITVNHGFTGAPETERTFFVEATCKKEAHQLAKHHLLDCGIHGYEYIVSIEEA